MKKLMTLMLGLGLAFGAVTVFASPNAPQKKSTKKSTKAPKKDADKK